MDCTETELTLTADDGVALAARRFDPVGEPLGSVVIHGAVATPRRYYDRFARWLATQGFTVLAYDYRGVGASRPRSLRGFHATLRARGTLVVDDGARAALVQGNRSLLPSGVRAVRGDFRRGDPVEIEDPAGQVFARGLVAYGALEMERIRGRNTREIGELLGEHHGDEAVHKDDLALLV